MSCCPHRRLVLTATHRLIPTHILIALYMGHEASHESDHPPQFSLQLSPFCTVWSDPPTSARYEATFHLIYSALCLANLRLS